MIVHIPSCNGKCMISMFRTHVPFTPLCLSVPDETCIRSSEKGERRKFRVQETILS